METVVWTYTIYLVVLIVITVWVGRTLTRHGKVLASDGREENSELVDALAHLLEVGFYLLTFGIISITLKHEGAILSTTAAIEILSWKIGINLFVLGFIHLLMTAVFSGIRKHSYEFVPPKPSNHSLDRFVAEVESRSSMPNNATR